MREQPNKRLDLPNPDAAQSVAGAPLCLLSGLAAQAHVSGTKLAASPFYGVNYETTRRHPWKWYKLTGGVVRK